MNLNKAERLARELMGRHGLNKWFFVWGENWKCIFGVCDVARRTIYLSSPLTELNSENEVKETILHEIAHALSAPGEGHGREWKRNAVRIGAVPERCYGSEVTQPQKRWIGVCPACEHRVERYRRSNADSACSPCCKKYNGGNYTDEYLLRWTPLQ